MMSRSCHTRCAPKHTCFQFIDEHSNDHATDNNPRSQGDEFSLAHLGAINPSRDRFRGRLIVVLVHVAVR
jgi:hypothetical protein